MDNLIAARHSTARPASAAQRLSVGMGAAAKPRRPRLKRKMPTDAAFGAILADCLAQASAQAGVLRDARSAAALHRLRVALRRLEVMLAAFAKVFDQRWFADLRGRAKAISSRLAPARDLDVFLEELWPRALRGVAQAGGDFAALKRAAQAAQDKAWTEVELCLASEDFAHLLDDIAALSQARLPMAGSDRLEAVARQMLQRTLRRVKKRGCRARALEESDLHRLRIALKKLRYLAQLFAPLYHGKKAKPYLAALKRLQQKLGRLNDIVHARATLAELRRKALPAEIGYSAGLFAGYYGAGRRRAAKAMQCYGDFKTLKPFW